MVLFIQLFPYVQCCGDVVQSSNRCRVRCTSDVCVLFIMLDLLAATSKASAKALIGPAAGYAGVQALG